MLILDKIINHLKTNLDLASNYCHKHTVFAFGEEKIKPVQMMIIDGQEVCPRCELDKETEQLSKQETERFKAAQENEKYNIFYKQSLVSDITILEADFNSYEAKEPEEIRNKNMCLDMLDKYRQGNPFNLILQGTQGVGKSHLAYSLLRELNESKSVSCAFISISSMIEKIKESFSNKESRFTESYFNNLLMSLDYLVLDDLGAETGAILRNNQGEITTRASDFVNRTLFNICDKRQGKSTIYTTNLASEEMRAIYEKRLVSRILSRPAPIVFKETKDKRSNQLPF